MSKVLKTLGFIGAGVIVITAPYGLWNWLVGLGFLVVWDFVLYHVRTEEYKQTGGYSAKQGPYKGLGK